MKEEGTHLGPLGTSTASEGSCAWIFLTHVLMVYIHPRQTVMLTSARGDVQRDTRLCSQT